MMSRVRERETDANLNEVGVRYLENLREAEICECFEPDVDADRLRAR